MSKDGFVVMLSRCSSIQLLVLLKTVQLIPEESRGGWDRGTFIRTLLAANYNPERAADYLFFGIPETDKITVPDIPSPGNLETVGDTILPSVRPAVRAGTWPVSRAPNILP